MFSGMWDSVFTKKRLVDTSGKLFSDRDDHPEGFVVDPKPLPEETVTEKHANYKHMFNRSYIEAATIGAGSIAVIAMILKYRKN